jgi:hypothetical protein
VRKFKTTPTGREPCYKLATGQMYKRFSFQQINMINNFNKYHNYLIINPPNFRKQIIKGKTGRFLPPEIQQQTKTGPQ